MSGRAWRFWNDWSLGAKSAAAVLLPTLVLMLSLLFSYRLQQGMAAAEADVQRALAIQGEIHTVHFLLAESAMGVRGYLLTNRDEFLGPFREASRQMPAALATLRNNIRDADMKARQERMERLLDRKLQSLDQLAAQGPSMEGPQLKAHLLGGKGLLDELRAELRAMNAREADLVAQYSERATTAWRRSLWVDALATALAVLAGLATFALLFGGIVLRVRGLAANAERLVQGAPLQELPAGRDELGQLADRLQNASKLLAAKAAQAQSASEAKSQFLSRTSHELRTPLNAILGFAQLLELDLSAPEQQSKVAHILAAGRHLLTLIDEVLDIARIESGELRLALAPMPLQPLVAEALALLRPLAAQKAVLLNGADSLGACSVLADRQRLLQVLLNLLSNAIKYNREGGSVTLSCAETANEVVLIVQDSGLGIAPEHIARLFTPFDRLGAEQTAVTGTGLGLSVSYQLARSMGGSLTATSRLGEGSTFSLRLPRAGDAPAGEIAPAANTEPIDHATAAGERRSVLVIEDNASNIALIEALIARRPAWCLLLAKDGESGLALARAERPDLILLDLHLPGLSGEAVLRRLRADAATKSCRIALVTADAQATTRERLLAAGADDFLTKPLAVPKLLALLDAPHPISRYD